MKRRVKLLIAALLAASAISATACGNPVTAEAEGEPPVVDIPSDVDLQTYVLPLDAYIFSLKDHRILDRARAIITTACLERFGYRVAVPQIPEPLQSKNAERYGIVDIGKAKRFGYHPDPLLISNRPVEPELPAGAYAVMHGEVSTSTGTQVPEGGCLGEARRQIKSVEQDRMAPAYALAGESSRKARNDSRVTAALGQWAACMAQRGYQYTDPLKANDDNRWQEKPSATTDEIQVAVADVECKRATNLVGVWISVESAYQERAVEKNSESLRELKTIMDRELRNAATVSAGAR
ncbi:hypothetical protein KBX06_03205 [Micromonospora sp. C31]|uniref:hypothetical protein n=1 Tax=Micromonospora sp. C31 TaxID=2824876 RepID=UPI001B36B660|nr:hypothetical protein [Micromonospora sp. C31]MBQ1072177.1 hypothetical protein [Micromonospora sp. C31]